MSIITEQLQAANNAILIQLLNNNSANGLSAELLANWNIVKGNSKVISYYTGVASGNPSGNANIETIKFYSSINGTNVLILTNTYTWNNGGSNPDQVLTITTS